VQGVGGIGNLVDARWQIDSPDEKVEKMHMVPDL
jgi:predicted component of type VI protein secretion system